MKDAGADVQRLKSALAAEIRRMLELERLSVREAQARTGIAAADFSRIRSSTDLGRFTIDRLMAIINRLGSRVEVDVRLLASEAGEAATLNTSVSL
jgi:predicted XRE-type DNA-binding protein